VYSNKTDRDCDAGLSMLLWRCVAGHTQLSFPVWLEALMMWVRGWLLEQPCMHVSIWLSPYTLGRGLANPLCRCKPSVQHQKFFDKACWLCVIAGLRYRAKNWVWFLWSCLQGHAQDWQQLLCHEGKWHCFQTLLVRSLSAHWHSLEHRLLLCSNVSLCAQPRCF